MRKLECVLCLTAMGVCGCALDAAAVHETADAEATAQVQEPLWAGWNELTPTGGTSCGPDSAVYRPQNNTVWTFARGFDGSMWYTQLDGVSGYSGGGWIPLSSTGMQPGQWCTWLYAYESGTNKISVLAASAADNWLMKKDYVNGQWSNWGAAWTFGPIALMPAAVHSYSQNRDILFYTNSDGTMRYYSQGYGTMVVPGNGNFRQTPPVAVRHYGDSTGDYVDLFGHGWDNRLWRQRLTLPGGTWNQSWTVVEGNGTTVTMPAVAVKSINGNYSGGLCLYAIGIVDRQVYANCSVSSNPLVFGSWSMVPGIGEARNIGAVGNIPNGKQYVYGIKSDTPNQFHHFNNTFTN